MRVVLFCIFVLLLVSVLSFYSLWQCCGFVLCVNVVVLFFVSMLWFCSLCQCCFVLCANVVVLLFVPMLWFCSVVVDRTAATPVCTLWGHPVHAAVR